MYEHLSTDQSAVLNQIFVLEGWINVEWDDGSLHGCRYTTSDFEDPRQIEVCNEPRRIPDNQTIATGCLVRQGR